MVEVRWDGVHPPSEIDVIRHVEVLPQELLSNLQLVNGVASQRVEVVVYPLYSRSLFLVFFLRHRTVPPRHGRIDPCRQVGNIATSFPSSSNKWDE